MLTAAAFYVLAFVSLGLAIDILLHAALGIAPPWNWMQFTWRFAFIWVLGLVTIGAPAGLGVREALMLVWFSPAIGESAALGVAAMLRMVTTAADVLVFLAASVSDTD